MSDNQLNFEGNKENVLGTFGLNKDTKFTIYEPTTNQVARIDKFRKKFVKAYPELEEKGKITIEGFDFEKLLLLTQEFFNIIIPELKKMKTMKKTVEIVEDSKLEISLDDAKKMNPEVKLGEEIEAQILLVDAMPFKDHTRLSEFMTAYLDKLFPPEEEKKEEKSE